MPANNDIELVNIFDSANPGLLAIAKSVLEDAGIEYMAIGENAGAVFAGNPFLGKVCLDVSKERAEEAEALLAALRDEPRATTSSGCRSDTTTKSRSWKAW